MGLILYKRIYKGDNRYKLFGSFENNKQTHIITFIYEEILLLFELNAEFEIAIDLEYLT